MSLAVTLPSGKEFTFCDRFSRARVGRWLVEARLLLPLIDEIPALPDFRRNLMQQAENDCIFSNAALAGNPLDQQETALIFARGGVGADQVNVREAANLAAAYDFLAGLSRYNAFLPLTENTIKKTHKALTQQLSYRRNIPGVYRVQPVAHQEGHPWPVWEKTPQSQDDIAFLMREFTAWMNSKPLVDQEPLIRAAMAHFHLLAICPFGAANGRAARAVEALILQMAGVKWLPYLLARRYALDPKAYLDSFEAALTSQPMDLTPFVSLVLEGAVQALHEVKRSLLAGLRGRVLREYYQELKHAKKLNDRQFKLVMLLLDQGGGFMESELAETEPLAAIFRKAGFEQARDEVEALVREGLLRQDEQGRYALDPKVV